MKNPFPCRRGGKTRQGGVGACLRQKDANRDGANRSEQAIERRQGREKRDLQGRVRAEVLGGRSKAVISW